MPDPIPDGDGVVSLSGVILAQDQDGSHVWIDPAALQSSEPRTELREDHLTRIR